MGKAHKPRTLAVFRWYSGLYHAHGLEAVEWVRRLRPVAPLRALKAGPGAQGQ
jgi:hypothetical protein